MTATVVYEFPPVGVIGSEWTISAPVSVSRSLVTGRRYVSAAQRRRRLAALDVSALAAGSHGAGYMEVLKRLLDGGVNLVRLKSRPINWHLHQRAGGQGSVMGHNHVEWTGGGHLVEWTRANAPVRWFSEPVKIITQRGLPAVQVSGVGAPDRLIARPGDFVTIHGPNGQAATIMVRSVAESRGGVVVIPLIEAAPFGGLIEIGASESGIFEALDIPRAVQPVGDNWSYGWQFSEVFPDEIGPFTEVDPWH